MEVRERRIRASGNSGVPHGRARVRTQRRPSKDDYALGLAALVSGVEGPYKDADVRQLAETFRPQIDTYVAIREDEDLPLVFAEVLQAARAFEAEEADAKLRVVTAERDAALSRAEQAEREAARQAASHPPPTPHAPPDETWTDW